MVDSVSCLEWDMNLGVFFSSIFCYFLCRNLLRRAGSVGKTSSRTVPRTYIVVFYCEVLSVAEVAPRTCTLCAYPAVPHTCSTSSGSPTCRVALSTSAFTVRLSPCQRKWNNLKSEFRSDHIMT